MATVTGMTAAAMDVIRDGAVTGAHFDSAGHLILTKYDGTQIDGGVITASSTTVAGVVELATSAETQTGTDAVRAVTPAGLASMPGCKILTSNAVAEATSYASYPNGTSLMDVSGWSLGSGFGTVVTHNIGGGFRCEQTFYSASGGTSFPQAWMRHYNSADGGGGWTAWRRFMAMATLTPASFTQTSALSAYPEGYSRLYYTSSNSGSWDFSGLYGEVVTYRDGTDFAKQTWTLHTNGAGAAAEVWIRTANAASGWSAWRKFITDPGAWSTWTPTWTTSSGSATPSYGNAVIGCRYIKLGRKVEGWIDITFGSTTNFGSGAGGGDNWLFALPVTAARAGDSIGFVELRQGNAVICMARIRTNTTGNVLLDICSGRPDGASIANTGDADAISPWTWASGNSIRGNFVYESAT
jgi:hypothetical protein